MKHRSADGSLHLEMISRGVFLIFQRYMESGGYQIDFQVWGIDDDTDIVNILLEFESLVKLQQGKGTKFGPFIERQLTKYLLTEQPIKSSHLPQLNELFKSQTLLAIDLHEVIVLGIVKRCIMPFDEENLERVLEPAPAIGVYLLKMMNKDSQYLVNKKKHAARFLAGEAAVYLTNGDDSDNSP